MADKPIMQMTQPELEAYALKQAEEAFVGMDTGYSLDQARPYLQELALIGGHYMFEKQQDIFDRIRAGEDISAEDAALEMAIHTRQGMETIHRRNGSAVLEDLIDKRASVMDEVTGVTVQGFPYRYPSGEQPNLLAVLKRDVPNDPTFRIPEQQIAESEAARTETEMPTPPPIPAPRPAPEADTRTANGPPRSLLPNDTQPEEDATAETAPPADEATRSADAATEPELPESLTGRLSTQAPAPAVPSTLLELYEMSEGTDAGMHSITNQAEIGQTLNAILDKMDAEGHLKASDYERDVPVVSSVIASATNQWIANHPNIGSLNSVEAQRLAIDYAKHVRSALEANKDSIGKFGEGPAISILTGIDSRGTHHYEMNLFGIAETMLTVEHGTEQAKSTYATDVAFAESLEKRMKETDSLNKDKAWQAARDAVDLMGDEYANARGFVGGRAQARFREQENGSPFDFFKKLMNAIVAFFTNGFSFEAAALAWNETGAGLARQREQKANENLHRDILQATTNDLGVAPSSPEEFMAYKIRLAEGVTGRRTTDPVMGTSILPRTEHLHGMAAVIHGLDVDGSAPGASTVQGTNWYHRNRGGNPGNAPGDTVRPLELPTAQISSDVRNAARDAAPTETTVEHQRISQDDLVMAIQLENIGKPSASLDSGPAPLK